MKNRNPKKIESSAREREENIMNIDEYKAIMKNAIASEVEARKFYEGVAEKVDDPYLKQLFNRLADEERMHRDILNKIYISNTIGQYFSETRDYKIAESVEEKPLSFDMKPADAMALAMQKEAAAVRQYTQMAEVCEDPDKKKVFLDLAAMEKEHKLKMENAFVDIGYPEVW